MKMKNIYSLVALLFLMVFGAHAQTRIYTPALRAPADGATGQTPDVTLDWDAVTGQGMIIYYELQLAQQPDFSDAITFPETTVTAMNMSLLKFDEIYFWRVRANDGITTSEWSEPFSFRVVATVTITKPDNNVIVAPNPTIKWDVLTGIDNYDIQIDTVESWSMIESGINKQLNDVFAINHDDAWIVGNDGTILQYKDNAWEQVESNTTTHLTSVYFTDASTGWAAGANGVILSYDGNDWTEMTSNTDQQLNGLYFTSATNGYAVGNSGTVLHYDGTSWSSIDNITGDHNDIHGLGPDKIWVVGKAGSVSIFDGTDWTKINFTNRDLLSIWALSEDKVWASSKGGRIFHFNGTDWAEQTSGSTRDLNSIFFLDEFNGFAVGNNGTLLSYNGSVWQSLASGTTQHLYGVSMADTENGFVTGATGIVISYQGDGFNSEYLKMYTTADDTTSLFQFHHLLFGKNHFFRMRAKHAESTSDWSPARLFTIIDKPTLKTPVNNAVKIDLDTIVKWDSISGVVGYTVQRATDADFTDPFTYETPIPEYRFLGLVFGQDYYWRANARHAGGVSNWSNTFKFTTADAVTLSFPENNATEITRLPVFTWQKIRGTQKYMIQFCENSSFDCPEEYFSNDNSWQTLFMLELDTRYYWRVRAIQGLDSTAWSPSWSFVTIKGISVSENNLQQTQIYPNPGDGLYTVQLPMQPKDMEIELFALTGKRLFYQKVQSISRDFKYDLDVRHLEKGVYMLRIRAEKETVTRKLIIE